MIITGGNYKINEIINIIKNKIKISKADQLTYILAIKVEKENNNCIISQIGFIEKLYNHSILNIQEKLILHV